MQGIRPGDVVVNSWAYGTHNGAFAFDEALHRWLNCVVVTTGTGNVTSSERQVELAIEYGASAILTTGDYLLRLADVARGMGYDPARLQAHGAPEYRRPRASRAHIRRRVLQLVRVPRGPVGVGGVSGARRAAYLRGRVHRSDRRSRHRRTSTRGRTGLDLHHPDLQDGEPAVPVQH